MLLAALLFFFLYTEYKTVDASPCTYNAEIIPSCTERYAINENVNVYHVNDVQIEEAVKCTCRIQGTGSVEIQVTNIPGYVNCDTSVNIVLPDNTNSDVACMGSLGKKYTMQLSRGIGLSFRKEANTTSSSPFCLHFSAIGSSPLNVSCFPREIESITTAQPGSSKITTPAIVTSAQTVRTSKSMTTIRPTSFKTTLAQLSSTTEFGTMLSFEESTAVTPYQNQTNISESTVTEKKTFSTLTTTTYPSSTKAISIIIIAPAAGGAGLLVLIVILIIVCIRCRRSKTPTDNAKLEGGIKNEQVCTYDNKALYQDDEMQYNILYESSDNIPKPAVERKSKTSENGGYSEVDRFPELNPQKDNSSAGEHTDFPVYSMSNKVKKNNEDDTSNEGPVYALPVKQNKSSDGTANNDKTEVPNPLAKPSKGQISERSATLNAEGLNYSDLEFKDEDPSNQKPLIKPKENTNYTEVR